MTTTQHNIDKSGILSEEQIAQIVARVLAIVRDEQQMKALHERGTALRVREAKLADLRAFEEMHNLPRAIPTRREKEG